MIGLLQAKGHVLTADPRGCRRSHRQYVLLYRGFPKRIDRNHSCCSTAQDFRIVQEINRYRLSCRALRLTRSEQTWLRWIRFSAPTKSKKSSEPLTGYPSRRRILTDGSDADFYLYDHTTPRTLIGPSYTAYMKIAEGCDHTCAFCIIPKIRGPIRSRSIPSLVQEAMQLADKGVKEITLVSQDTTSYGLDLGIQDGLAKLLEALSKIDGLRWIRFLYAYPNQISQRLIDAINSSEKICKYIDMPLQHVSASILKSMRRGGNRASLAAMIERIKKGIPGVTLRTTMIVGLSRRNQRGFPGAEKVLPGNGIRSSGSLHILGRRRYDRHSHCSRKCRPARQNGGGVL